MARRGYVAFDLGAESGRAMLAVLNEHHLELHELHRFANCPQHLPSGYHWSLLELWRNLVEGLRQCGKTAREQHVELASLGVDTWGTDIGLVGKAGQLLGLPYAYRDDSHFRAFKKTIDEVGERTIYEATGIQFMPFNTLYQLIARHEAEPEIVAAAHRMLNMPDLLHYFFSGEAINEATIASTTQMIDPFNGQWAMKLLHRLRLPTHMLGKIVPAGTKIGRLRQQVADEAGVGQIDVIVPASHDTASAVAAVPVESSADTSWAYLSSGTWSLMGVELEKPIVSEASHSVGFTNERGMENKIRFLKNISGLWLVQEVRADLQRHGETYDYSTLTDMAAAAPSFKTLVDPGHEPFASPGNMRAKIDAYAQETDQRNPQTSGEYVRCCLESLALSYRHTLEALETILGKRIEAVHIVGGGGKNTLLNQMTADAIGRTVIVGPYEATAIGNALSQAIGAGQVKDLAHLRQIVRVSFELKTYQPQNAAGFEKPYQRFCALL